MRTQNIGPGTDHKERTIQISSKYLNPPRPMFLTSDDTSQQNDIKKPTVVIIIGMAGSGKTTMLKALYAQFSKPAIIPTNAAGSTENTETTKRQKLRTYVINLDPAVLSTPIPVNVDIRDTINYKQVMKEYKLGPNGAIMTSLNLFSTKFDQVLGLLEKRAPQLDVVIIDTPGQIEAFNWSASGSIILDSIAVTFPTVVLYVVDTARCASPVTFMSNMTYACSVLYKSKLPFVLAFNKIDVRSAEKCFEWMKSYDTYATDAVNEDSYMASLSRSCALAMNEFYEGIRSLGCSAATHMGLDKLEASLIEARKEYYSQYLPWLTAQRDAVKRRPFSQRREELAKSHMKKFEKDRKEDVEEKRQLEELREKYKKTDFQI